MREIERKGGRDTKRRKKENPPHVEGQVFAEIFGLH